MSTQQEILAAPPKVSARTVLVCALPALLLATVCLLPFLQKAYNIDDPLFLGMAQQIVKQPLHPMDFDVCWDVSTVCTKAYLLTPGTALMGYALAPTVLSGGQEWAAHLTQLAFAWIAILAMTSLIFRFGWDRWHATVGALLLAAVPPFLPMASTAMPDLLAATLGVVAMERLAAWKEDQKWGRGAAAAIALGLAGFTRPHLAFLLPVAAFFLLESTDPKEILAQVRRRWRLWAPVFAGAVLLFVLIAAIRETKTGGNSGIAPPSFLLFWSHIPRNLTAYLFYLAFPLPLAGCWLVHRWRSGGRRAVMRLLAWAFAVVLVFRLIGWYELSVLFLAIVAGGALTSLLLAAWRKRDQTELLLMLWILIPLPIVCYEHLPIKYLLPCMPAVILLCFRLVEGVPARVLRAATVAVIVASTGYSVLILRSDADFADFGRSALHTLIAPHVAAGETVWFPGQAWSYWYAPIDGAKLTFPGGPQPRSGDLLVVDEAAVAQDVPLSRFPHRTLVEAIPEKYRFGRTMGAGAGLYSNWYGYWLWGFGESEKDRYELWRID